MQQLTCPIRSISYFNHDTRQIFVDVPDELSFKAGQYLQLILPNKKCPFSIASSPHLKGQIELHVRPTPGSDDSVAIEALLNDATALDIELPLGDCFLAEPPGNTLILIAASTGITQMKSIIEFLEPGGFEHPVYLYWGVLRDADFYLADLCRSWEDRHDNFHFVPVVSEPGSSPDWKGRSGLVGEAVLEDFDDLSDVTVFVSGGPAMVYATLDAFVEKGMPEQSMHSDIFSYAPRK